MSPARLSDGISMDTRSSFTGDTPVAFGIGIDLTSDLRAFDPADVSALSCTDPANRGDREMYLHTHGVVFRNVPFDDTRNLNSQVRTIVTDGEFMDIRHLPERPRLSRETVGIAHTRSIVRDP